jgi:hypothetical protein
MRYECRIEKAPLEGMSGAFRDACRSRRPLRERSRGGDRKSPAVLMRFTALSDKRELGRSPMLICMGSRGDGLGKKRAPSEDGALQKWGKRTREEETPFAVGPNRGRRVRFRSVSQDAGPREEDSVRRPVDTVNMCLSSLSSNAPAGMPAMRSVRIRSAYVTHFVAAKRIARFVKWLQMHAPETLSNHRRC